MVDPHRTVAAGKVEIGAFRTYPEVRGVGVGVWGLTSPLTLAFTWPAPFCREKHSSH